MRRQILSFVLALGVAAGGGALPAHAFVEDRAPTFGNGGVDPNATGDPAAVAAAQRALQAFFDYTNHEYGPKGYANAWLMREELGNHQSNWLDMTLPLSCGRLVSGYKNMNWIPGKGWQHEAPPTPVALGASAPCEYQAPTFTNSGADPNHTYDPPTVAAAQAALNAFYRETNLGYSIGGYSNPWSMREALGNQQSDWLDMTLPLARGHLLGGYKHMNWIPGRGWRHEAPPTLNVARDSLLTGAPPQQTVAWIADRTIAPALPPELSLTPRKPANGIQDAVAVRIMGSFGLDLGGKEGF